MCLKMFSSNENNTGTVPAFLSKLWMLVEDRTYDDLISWGMVSIIIIIFFCTIENVLVHLIHELLLDLQGYLCVIQHNCPLSIRAPNNEEAC